nr:NUDIX domain-containing protein [Pseudomonas tohonis]
MTVHKTCPVVLRQRGTLEILAFLHPLAGRQLVKGSVEPGETSAAAAVRELAEEAGVQGEVIRDLGTWQATGTGHTWAFHACRVDPDLADTWSHDTEDDGGHRFRFFWHPLDAEPTEEWHPIFRDALTFIRQALR